MKILIYLLLVLPILTIVYFWWQASGYLIFGSFSNQLIALGRIAGLLLVYFVLLQIILRSRITLLESILGFMTLNSLHKKNGYLIFTLLFLHPLFLLSGYTLAAKINVFSQIYLFLFTYEGVFKAFISLLLFSGIIFSSIYLVRKKLPYELWYLIHLTTYIAILFAWDHQLKVGGDFQTNFRFVVFWYALYGIVFANLIYWRIWKQTYLFYKHRFYITKIVKETHDTYSLYLGGKHINTLNFKPGQFAFLRILRQDTWWESHPFSFSQTSNKKYIRFTIKALGDFTKKIRNIPLRTQVILDGPHGEFTIDEKGKRKLLFIAGGAGITPIRSLLEKFGDKNTFICYVLT